MWGHRVDDWRRNALLLHWRIAVLCRLLIGLLRCTALLHLRRHLAGHHLAGHQSCVGLLLLLRML